MNYPTVKQLRYFIALVEHNHFGKAAQSSFVSQSAFSVAIKELEKCLNGRLVDRTNKSVTVTNLGRETYNQAKIVMNDLSDLIEISSVSDIPFSGKLALGIIPTIAPFLLPLFLSSLQEKYKSLELYLYEEMTHSLYEKLMKGDLDVILVALPFSMKNVEYNILFKDNFSLAFQPKSKWIRKKGNKQYLNDDSVLLLEDGHCMRDHALSACKLKETPSISRYSASSMLTLVEMVKSDIGVTFLPEMSLHSPLIQQSGLQIESLDDNSFRNIGLVWRKGSSRKEEFLALGDYIKSHIN